MIDHDKMNMLISLLCSTESSGSWRYPMKTKKERYAQVASASNAARGFATIARTTEENSGQKQLCSKQTGRTTKI